jgi:hypothetical protein
MRPRTHTPLSRSNRSQSVARVPGSHIGDTPRHEPTRRKEETEREVAGQRTESQR